MELLQKIYTTDGRLNRLRFLKYYLILGLIFTILCFVVSIAIAFVTSFHVRDLIEPVAGILSIFMHIGDIMLGIRRLHDLDKSGWFALLLLIPAVNLFFLLYLFFAPGTVGYNRYGADPLNNFN